MIRSSGGSVGVRSDHISRKKEKKIWPKTCLGKLRGIGSGFLSLQYGKRMVGICRLAMSMVRVTGVALAINI